MKTRELKLSERLQAVAAMVTEGGVVCDVGCDHGFVPVCLVKSGISPKVIAMDINEGPLQAAREHIGEYLLADYIETRLSDGVAALGTGEADTLICGGMGGRLIKRIMEEGKEKIRQMREVILQPQSEIAMVREYLRKEGYAVADEKMVLEEGKYYPVIKALPVFSVQEDWEKKDGGRREEADSAEPEQGGEPEDAGWRKIEDKYGPVVLNKKDPVLEDYLRREYSLCMQIMENLRENGRETEGRQEEIADRIRGVEAALSCYR